MQSTQAVETITVNKQEEDAIFSKNAVSALLKHCESHGIKCSVTVEGSSRPDDFTFAGRYYSEQLTVAFQDGVKFTLIAGQQRADWLLGPATNGKFPKEYDYSMVLKPNGIKIELNEIPFARVIPQDFTGSDLSRTMKEFRNLVTILGQAETV